MIVPFEVNDPSLRKEFLGATVFAALEELSPDQLPRWGRMSPQQMTEHLVWAMEVSNGGLQVECRVPRNLVPRFRAFLFDDRPARHEFMNPLLRQGLPSLRFAGIREALGALRDQSGVFLDQEDGAWGEPRVHPVFGPLNHEEWTRAHFKHFYHHLLQFDLIGEDPR
jgi:hypothetical protein